MTHLTRPRDTVSSTLVAASERFWSKVQVGQPDECWPWLAGRTPFGHGKFRLGPQTVYAHRFVYELTVGPIPPGLTVDHECHNRDPSCPGGNSCEHRRCVNPTHLNVATHRQNLLNGKTPARANAEKTHCPAGHPYDWIRVGRNGQPHRKCRRCHNASTSKSHRRARGTL